jgi:hypothetical protein
MKDFKDFERRQAALFKDLKHMKYLMAQIEEALYKARVFSEDLELLSAGIRDQLDQQEKDAV